MMCRSNLRASISGCSAASPMPPRSFDLLLQKSSPPTSDVTPPFGGGGIPSKGEAHQWGSDGGSRSSDDGAYAFPQPMGPATMTSPALQAVNLRLDIMSMALAELARALPPTQAARVAEAIVKQAMGRLAGASISEITDESIAADLAPLLSALHRR